MRTMIKEIDLTKMSNFRIHTPAGTYKINIEEARENEDINIISENLCNAFRGLHIESNKVLPENLRDVTENDLQVFNELDQKYGTRDFMSKYVEKEVIKE